MKIKKPISCLLNDLNIAKSRNLIKSYFVVYGSAKVSNLLPYIIITPFLSTPKNIINKLMDCIVRDYNTIDAYLMYDNARIRVDYE